VSLLQVTIIYYHFVMKLKIMTVLYSSLLCVCAAGLARAETAPPEGRSYAKAGAQTLFASDISTVPCENDAHAESCPGSAAKPSSAALARAQQTRGAMLKAGIPTVISSAQPNQVAAASVAVAAPAIGQPPMLPRRGGVSSGLVFGLAVCGFFAVVLFFRRKK
jgi:hypothetical protein